MAVAILGCLKIEGPRMESLSLIQRIAIWLIPALFAITLHEVAHGWMARKLGDSTAMMLGRLSLNPIKHVDPVGTILIPGLLLWAGGFLFGWAKPVPVTWQNLRQPKRDMALVAVAGPAANLLMGAFWVLVIKFAMVAPEALFILAEPLLYMGVAGIFINSILMILNLFPIPPLDGGRVLTGLLPGPWAWRVAKIEPYGMLIVLALLMSGLLGKILWPFIYGVQIVLSLAAGLPPEWFQAILSGLFGR